MSKAYAPCHYELTRETDSQMVLISIIYTLVLAQSSAKEHKNAKLCLHEKA
jgi:predicted RecB family nuclease